MVVSRYCSKKFGCCMWGLALLVALIMDILKLNAAMIELVGIIVLIVSASTLKKRDAEKLDYALVVGSGFASIVLSFLFDNGSMLMLGGVITIIVGMAMFMKKAISSLLLLYVEEICGWGLSCGDVDKPYIEFLK